jgi:glucosamine-6-phosphate deaminase
LERRAGVALRGAAALRIDVHDGPGPAVAAAAGVVAGLVAARPDAVLALPTGRTAVPLYAELAARHASGRLDLGRVRGFNLDELVLPAGDPRTFRAFMGRHAWGVAGLRRERCDIPDGAAADLEAECERYEAAIAAAGGLELALLGVGADGHVAYNMPGPASPATHVATLPDGLAEALGVPAEARPLRAITMGIGTLRGARRILVLALGPAKARAVRALVRGPADARWPCTLLRDHPGLELIADRDAAQAL